MRVSSAAFVFAIIVSLSARAGDDAPSVRWKTAGDRHVVEVVGLDRPTLDGLKPAEFTPEQWSALLRISVRREHAQTDAARTPMLGSYRIENTLVRFRPKFPLEPGLTYEAVFDPSKLPGTRADHRNVAPIVATLTLDAAPTAATTTLDRIDPIAETVPENLLKFYLTFSAPMSRGHAYQRVRVLDSNGKPLDLPFLEIGEELWDRTNTRLTLLFDPGRIKSELKPKIESGPILVSGRTYTLVVDASWPDAEGRPLVAGVRKPFRAGPADHESPDPKTWKIQAPKAGTREALVVSFPESLDRALLGRLITVQDHDGRAVAGRARIESAATSWSFVPEVPWALAEYRIVAGRDLEDLAGNSIGRPFEVDEFQVDRPGERAAQTVLPFHTRVAPN